MKKILIWVALVTACATSPVQKGQNAAETPSFEAAKQSLAVVHAAGEKCLIPDRLDKTFQSCPLQPDVYDRAACLAFDEAIQEALEPIRTCAQSRPDSAPPDERAACVDYINHFLQPCIGVHALHLAYSENAQSEAYRTAIASGADEATAREKYLSDLVRYRD